MEFIHDITNSIIPPCAATIGFFDGVHLGHRFLIEQVKAVAYEKGLASVLITFTCHPRKVMNKEYQPELLSTLQEKKELLQSTGADYCVFLEFTPAIAALTAREFMASVLKSQLNVYSLVIGYDHRFGRNRVESFPEYHNYGNEMGMGLVKAEAYEVDGIKVSSTVVRNFLMLGKVEIAAKCLGYEYHLDGTVVGGYKVGRTIGFPTANLCIGDPDKLLPADGVYAVRVRIEGRVYMGMLNIGHRPTFNSGSHKGIEVHILDFSSDIYEYTIRISFVHYLRSDIKFASVEGLIAQLRQDEETVRQLLG